MTTDVAIIGAGPIGLELAVALQRAGVDYQHFEARQVGHTISWFAPGTRFFSSNERIAIAGVPLVTPDQSKATREQYLAYLHGVVEQFDLAVHTGHRIVGVEREDGGFVLRARGLRGEKICTAKRVVLAKGNMDGPRLIGVPGEDLPHVSHYLGEPLGYFRQKVVIVGSRNSAVEAALRVFHAGAEVTLVCRGPALPPSIKYWLLPEINSLVKAGAITAHFSSRVTAITPQQVSVQRAQQGDLGLPADRVLLLTGYVPDNTLLDQFGVELQGPDRAPRFDLSTMETRVKGVYVAGTVTGGEQARFTVFIENCHANVDKIVSAITGTRVTRKATPLDMAES